MPKFVGKVITHDNQMESKEAVQALFQYANEGILITNEKGAIIRMNSSAEKLFGYKESELLGQKIEVLIPKRFASAHQHHRQDYNSHPKPRSMGSGMSLFAVRKDQTEFPVEISLSPYAGSDGNYIIAFVIDITIRKQSEEKLKNYSVELEQQVKNRTMILEEAIEELEKTKAELYHALSKEKELNDLKSRFVSMASHEFRTPLSAILTSLSLVKRYGDLNDKEKQEKHFNRIKETVATLTEILNDVLSISRLEEGRTENNPEHFSIKEFFEKFLTDMHIVAGEHIKIHYKHSGNEEAYLDRKLLTLILNNVVSNAIKFTESNGKIHIESEITNSSLLITVHDNGIGISKEDQAHLFERFFRGKNASHIQGTGLGLNIVLRCAELMNGTVSLESEENVGTKVTLTFQQ